MKVDSRLAAYEKNLELFAVENLRAGIILLAIGGAACALEYPDDQTPVHWEDEVFLYDDLNGTSVAVQVTGTTVIGLCQYTRSERHVWHTHDPAGAESLVRHMPLHLRDEAKRMAARYLLVELDDGTDVPCITAAFWSSDGWWLTAAEPWADVLLHGAEAVLRPALMRLDRAIPIVQNVLSLSDRQMKGVVSLYERRMAAGTARLVISVDELRALFPEEPSALDRGFDFLRQHFDLSEADAEAFASLPPFGTGSVAACRELLAVVGVDVTDG